MLNTKLPHIPMIVHGSCAFCRTSCSFNRMPDVAKPMGGKTPDDKRQLIKRRYVREIRKESNLRCENNWRPRHPFHVSHFNIPIDFKA